MIDFFEKEYKIKLMPQKELFTKQETTEYLRISMNTLYRLMKSGELPYIKLERRVLFKKDDIDRFIESKRVD